MTVYFTRNIIIIYYSIIKFSFANIEMIAKISSFERIYYK